MKNVQRTFSIFMLPILLTACASSQPTASPSSFEPSKEPQATATLSLKEKIATAIAIDNATKAVKPTAIINAGFESNPPQGWETAGEIESGGYGGGMRLTHRGGNTPVESIQKLSDISNGWYTLKVWVSSSGKQKEAYIALKNCGDNEARASVPIVQDKWLQIVVSAKVTKHQCTISLYSDAEAGEWVSFDNVEFVPGRAALTVMGADISSLKKSEDKGGVYTYEDGTEHHPRHPKWTRSGYHVVGCNLDGCPWQWLEPISSNLW